jgi:predicted nucleic acid-binding protein
MDELFYRLLLSRIKEFSGRNPLDVLREDLTKTIADHGPAIEEPLRKLAALPHLNLVGLETRDFYRMLENINRFSLLPRDALHLAIIQRLEIPGIATDDLDFDRVETIDRRVIVKCCVWA